MAADRFMVFIPGSTSPPVGPMTEEQLRASVDAGAFPRDAKVSKVGESSWRDVTELVPLLIEESLKTVVDVPVIPRQWEAKEPEPEKTFEVTVDGENVVGPVTLDQLRRGVGAGKLPKDAQARVVGSTTWGPIGDLLSDGKVKPAVVESPDPKPKMPSPPSGASGPRIPVGVVAAAGLAFVGVVVAVVIVVVRSSNPIPAPATSTSISSASGTAASPPPAPPAPAQQVEVVARGLINPMSLAVANATLFVTVHGKPASKEDADGSIASLVLDGKSELKVIVKKQVFPSTLVLDRETLFWATLDRKIVRSSTGGGGTKTIHKFDGGLPLLVGVDDEEVFVATNKLGPGDGEGHLVAIRRDGSKVRELYEGPAILDWALGKDAVFFCQAALGYIPKKGSEGTVLERGMGARSDAGLCHASVVDGRRVFFHQPGTAGGIKLWDLDKSGSTSLAVEPAQRLAVAGDHVYWSHQEHRGPARIRRVAVAGGGTEPIVEGVPEITEFVVSFPYVYWTSQKAGTVSRVLLPGAEAALTPRDSVPPAAPSSKGVMKSTKPQGCAPGDQFCGW